MDRHWITGVQLGMLCSDNRDGQLKLIDEIIDKQYLGKVVK